MNIFKNQAGMTLMELLVSISIIALMSTMFVVNIKSYNKSGDLLIAAHELANNIRLVQNYSLGLKEYDNAGTNVMPAGGWGVYLTSQVDIPPVNNFYTIFADHRDNQEHWINGDEHFRYVYLPDGIIISRLTLYNISGGSNDRPRATISYGPPDPKIYICRGSNDCNHWAIEIILEEAATTNTITIRLNVHGLVDIN